MRILFISLSLLFVICWAENALSVESPKDRATKEKLDLARQVENAKVADKIIAASAKKVRQFHEVLDELLAEFGYDVRSGILKDVKNLSIRRVIVSDALPHTYKKYVGMLITERIVDNTNVRLVNCISCNIKSSKLVDGTLRISSPSANLSQLQHISRTLGIDNFMDIVLVYHSTHMVLGFEIYKADSNELLWARTYNSETIRSRFQKLAIDYNQVAKSRVSNEYEPEYRTMFGIGGGGIPNTGGQDSDSSMLTLHFRATERFDNRRSEFGLLLATYHTVSSLLSDYPVVEGTGGKDDEEDQPNDADVFTPATPQPFSTAVTLNGLYVYNFLDTVESFNQIRHGINMGIGGVFASGYFAGTTRLGWDINFGKTFTLGISGIYIMPSTIMVENKSVDTKGGGGLDVVVSYAF
jgi:hypothetical protein